MKSKRTNTGCFIRQLFKLSFADLNLIKYPEGAYLPEHRDTLPWQAYLDLNRPSWAPKPICFRLNIVLQDALEGGQFICEKSIIRTRRIVLFRPDKYRHRVTKILRGTRYVLSLGFAL